MYEYDGVLESDGARRIGRSMAIFTFPKSIFHRIRFTYTPYTCIYMHTEREKRAFATSELNAVLRKEN